MTVEFKKTCGASGNRYFCMNDNWVWADISMMPEDCHNPTEYAAAFSEKLNDYASVAFEKGKKDMAVVAELGDPDGSFGSVVCCAAGDEDCNVFQKPKDRPKRERGPKAKEAREAKNDQWEEDKEACKNQFGANSEHCVNKKCYQDQI